MIPIDENGNIIIETREAAAKRTVVIDDSYPGRVALEKKLREEGADVHVTKANDRVTVVGGSRVGRTGRGLQLQQAALLAATLADTVQRGPTTGREMSKQHSANVRKVFIAEQEERALLRRFERPRQVAMSPNFAAPYSNLTDQDHERLAAAQAKRDRRAAKKGRP